MSKKYENTFKLVTYKGFKNKKAANDPCHSAGSSNSVEFSQQSMTCRKILNETSRNLEDVGVPVGIAAPLMAQWLVHTVLGLDTTRTTKEQVLLSLIDLQLDFLEAWREESSAHQGSEDGGGVH